MEPGVGISASMTKVPGTRVALVGMSQQRDMPKKESDANIIAFGGRILGQNLINSDQCLLETNTNQQKLIKKLIEKIIKVIEVNLKLQKIIISLTEENAKWDRSEYHD